MTDRPLTATQRLMLRCSAAGAVDDVGRGVALIGAGNWSTARKLEALSLGWIENKRSTASAIAGHFFANAEGLTAVAEIAA